MDEGPQLAQRHARAQAGRQPDHLGPEYLDAGGGEIMVRGDKMDRDIEIVMRTHFGPEAIV